MGERKRIALGLKQMNNDPWEGDIPGRYRPGEIKKGSVVTCEVTEVKEGGLDVKIVGSDLTTFIKRSELARDRGVAALQRRERGADEVGAQ